MIASDEHNCQDGWNHQPAEMGQGKVSRVEESFDEFCPGL